MLRSAKELLLYRLNDPIVVQYTSLIPLPEPPYVEAFRRGLLLEGIRHIDIRYRPEWRKIPNGSECWRVYGVLSFVWRDRLYIVRAYFREIDLANWDPNLRRIWTDTWIDVPNEVVRLP